MSSFTSNVNLDQKDQKYQKKEEKHEEPTQVQSDYNASAKWRYTLHYCTISTDCKPVRI